MRNRKHNLYLVIFISYIIATLLSVLPLPAWATDFRPEWLLLLLIYWSIAAPHRVGLVLAWITGFMLDLLYGSVMGEHAMAFVIVIYFAQRMYLQVRLYPVWQQAFVVSILCFMYQCCILLIHGMLGQFGHIRLFWLPALTSLLLWPWLVTSLRDTHQKYQIR